MIMKLWCKKAETIGFSYAVPLDPATIDLKQEVRDMCAANSCGQYGKNWSCPPGCGELHELREKIKNYSCGLLVQTVGDVEDSFDIEAMIETEKRHKHQMEKLHQLITAEFPNAITIGAGCCAYCQTCTYPELPCRFPEKQISSMEAYGMLVSDVCCTNQLPYSYGPEKIVYTGCCLLK